MNNSNDWRRFKLSSHSSHFFSLSSCFMNVHILYSLIFVFLRYIQVLKSPDGNILGRKEVYVGGWNISSRKLFWIWNCLHHNICHQSEVFSSAIKAHIDFNVFDSLYSNGIVKFSE